MNVVRAFEDGDCLFGHTECDFATRKIGFAVFRFEYGQAVEHWDNIEERLGPNESGRSMVDGPTAAEDLGLTESNRDIVRSFIETVVIGGDLERIAATARVTAAIGSESITSEPDGSVHHHVSHYSIEANAPAAAVSGQKLEKARRGKFPRKRLLARLLSAHPRPLS